MFYSIWYPVVVVGRGSASGNVALCVASSWFCYITLPTLMMHGQTEIQYIILYH